MRRLLVSLFAAATVAAFATQADAASLAGQGVVRQSADQLVQTDHVRLRRHAARPCNCAPRPRRHVRHRVYRPAYSYVRPYVRPPRVYPYRTWTPAYDYYEAPTYEAVYPAPVYAPPVYSTPAYVPPVVTPGFGWGGGGWGHGGGWRGGHHHGRGQWR